MRDLTAIAAVAGERVDVLWSSFPCQAWSTAGARRGAHDGRNGWPWTVDAVDRFKPAWFLGENVRGLLLHRSGCTAAGGQRGLFGTAAPEDCPGCYFERVILPDLRARFACVGWWLLDAADFGVPQHRRRVILWAGPAPLTAPVPTHGPGRARPWVSMREALGLDGEVYTQRNPETARGGNRWVPTSEPSTTVSCVGKPQIRPSVRVVAPNCRPPVDYTDQPAPTIDSHTGVAGDNYEQALRIVFSDLLAKPSPTISAQLSGPHGQDAWAYIPDGTGRRRLTVAECARLQDFPGGHPWQGGVGAQYRQVGNAVPPRLAEVVGRALMAAIEDVRGLS